MLVLDNKLPSLGFFWIFPELKFPILFLCILTKLCNVSSTTIETLLKVEYVFLFFTECWSNFYMNRQNHAASYPESPFRSRDHSNYSQGRQCQGSKTAMTHLPLSSIHQGRAGGDFTGPPSCSSSWSLATASLPPCSLLLVVRADLCPSFRGTKLWVLRK